MEILMVSLTLPIFQTTRTIILDHLSGFRNTDYTTFVKKRMTLEGFFNILKGKKG